MNAGERVCVEGSRVTENKLEADSIITEANVSAEFRGGFPYNLPSTRKPCPSNFTGLYHTLRWRWKT